MAENYKCHFLNHFFKVFLEAMHPCMLTGDHSEQLYYGKGGAPRWISVMYVHLVVNISQYIVHSLFVHLKDPFHTLNLHYMNRTV